MGFGFERESQRKFVVSVQNLIQTNPLIYPTVSQAEIVDRLYRHLSKRQLSDVERQVREDMGL